MGQCSNQTVNGFKELKYQSQLQLMKTLNQPLKKRSTKGKKIKTIFLPQASLYIFPYAQYYRKPVDLSQNSTHLL